MLNAKVLRLLFAGVLAAGGLVVGFGIAVNLSEEDRRRIKKAVFELKELPRRVLV